MLNHENEKIDKKIAKELEDYKTKMKIVQSQKMNKLRLEKLKKIILIMRMIKVKMKKKKN